MSFAKHRSKCNSIGSDYAMQSPAHLCYSAPFKLLVHNFAKRLVSILNLCVGPPGTTYHTQVRRSVPCNPHVLQHLSLRFHLFFICVHTTHAGQTQCALQPTRTTAPFAALSPVFVFVFLRRTQVRCSVPCKTYTYYNTFRCAFTCFVFVFLRRTQVRRSVPCNPHVLQHLSLRFHLFCICVHTTHAGQTQRAPAICTCNGSSCSAPRQQPFTCESSCCRGLLHI